MSNIKVFFSTIDFLLKVVTKFTQILATFQIIKLYQKGMNLKLKGIVKVGPKFQKKLYNS